MKKKKVMTAAIVLIIIVSLFMVPCGSNTPKGDSSSDESGQVSSTIISDSKVLENTSEDNSSIAGESENKGNSGASSSTSGTASLLKNEVSNVASSAKSVETTKPQTTTQPTATQEPAPTPAAPQCAEVGHTTAGTCPTCGAVKSIDINQGGDIIVGDHTGDGGDATDSEMPDGPQCGSIGHSVDGTCDACGASYTAPKCGAVGHTADGKCQVCGNTYTTPVATPAPTPVAPQCAEVGHTTAGTCPTCGAVKSIDKNESHEFESGDHTGDGGDAEIVD